MHNVYSTYLTYQQLLFSLLTLATIGNKYNCQTIMGKEWLSYQLLLRSLVTLATVTKECGFQVLCYLASLARVNTPFNYGCYDKYVHLTWLLGYIC